MVRYTLHVFEAGNPTPAEHRIDCASDGEAINSALDIARGRAVELWSAGRLVLISPTLTPAAQPLGHEHFVMGPVSAGRRRPVDAGLAANAR